jgi:hypothetical protein
MGPMANATVRSSGLQPSTTAMHGLLRCMSLFMALFGSAHHSDEGQLSGVKRKWLAHRESDAIEP